MESELTIKFGIQERLRMHAIQNNQILSDKSKSSSIGQILLWSIAFISTNLSHLDLIEYLIWGVLFSVNIFRFGLARWGTKIRNPLTWYCLYVLATLVTAIGCGLISSYYLMKFDFNSELTVLILVTNAGVVAAATAGLSPDKILARAFISLCLMPLVETLLFFTGSSHLGVALVVSIYAMFLFAQIEIQSNVILGLRDRELQLQAVAETSRENERQGLILAAEREKVARESVSVKTNFLATVSHELRTPLNAIIGISDLLETVEDENLRKKYAYTLKSSSESLLNLVNDILDFSKIEGNMVALESLPFNLSEIIESQVELISSKASGKGITVTSEIDAQLPVGLRGDASRIGQIVMNLMDNAIKFTDSGSVKVSCRLVHKYQDNARVRVEVKDTGIGIKPDQAKVLFNPFTQGDSSTSRKYGGTGLGLSICHRLVARMKGQISLDSEVGQGTTIWFEIPFPIAENKTFGQIQETAPEKVAEAAGVNALPSARILVAEDNTTNQMLTLALLRNLGLQCQAVVNGKEALDAWQTGEFDLILMDCQMPEMDGFEATEQIRKRELLSGGHIPIVALTANVFESDRRKCFSCGMDGFIPKPVKRQKLAEELKNFLVNKSAVAS